MRFIALAPVPQISSGKNETTQAAGTLAAVADEAKRSSDGVKTLETLSSLGVDDDNEQDEEDGADGDVTLPGLGSSGSQRTRVKPLSKKERRKSTSSRLVSGLRGAVSIPSNYKLSLFDEDAQAQEKRSLEDEDR